MKHDFYDGAVRIIFGSFNYDTKEVLFVTVQRCFRTQEPNNFFGETVHYANQRFTTFSLSLTFLESHPYIYKCVHI